ncbi:T9SS type A sorting domain-containing protein [Pedobacter sp. SYSU D00535]|uniref:T9SS type A sorting domain-containing protein n=1 Tax=Pedobacter sp. SYSU D00535 TaxID=2810308 RepID=UPI001A96C655|nr:T9SS type A sorting domain-containing protein [Pedobacter sp. SYSU D00535]
MNFFTINRGAIRRIGLLALVAMPYVSFTQGLFNNGANVVVKDNATININGTSGNYRSEASGVIKNESSNGTISLGGNWINNATNSGFTNSGATVVLNGSGAQSLQGSTPSYFYNLTANGTGTKTVNTSASVQNIVTVGSSTTLNANGLLTLLATETSNANIGPLLDGASVSGIVNVQAHFSGGTARHRISRPISTPIDDAAAAVNTYKQLQSHMIITGPGGTNKGFDLGGSAAPQSASLNKYNETVKRGVNQFTAIENITDRLNPGTGVFVFYRGNRTNYSAKVNAPFAIPEAQVVTYRGPVNQGNKTVNLSYTFHSDDIDYNGFNLVGNPYPCVIDWTLVTKDLDLVHDELVIPTQTGSYVTYKEGIVINGTPNASYIMPGKGFYVRAKGTGASLTFTENCKVPTMTPERLMSASFQESLALNAESYSNRTSFSSPRIIKQLRMSLQDDLNTEETVSVFKPGNSAKSGMEDAIFWAGSTVSISTLSADDKKLSINGMPQLEEVQELKLSVTGPAGQTLRLKFTDLSAIEGAQIFLKDNYLNKVTAVNLGDEYTFTIDKSVAASSGNDRFVLLFNKPTVLSESLLSVSAKKEVRGAEVKWTVATSNRADRFEVEKAVNGDSFTPVSTVRAIANNEGYTFVDENPVNGTNSYRIKQFDEIGRYNYSQTVSLKYSFENTASYTVYPNPATDKIVVQTADRKSPTILRFLNLQGQEVKTTKIAAMQALEADVSALPTGVYILQIIDASTNSLLASTKLVKH